MRSSLWVARCSIRRTALNDDRQRRNDLAAEPAATAARRAPSRDRRRHAPFRRGRGGARRASNPQAAVACRVGDHASGTGRSAGVRCLDRNRLHSRHAVHSRAIPRREWSRPPKWPTRSSQAGMRIARDRNAQAERRPNPSKPKQAKWSPRRHPFRLCSPRRRRPARPMSAVSLNRRRDDREIALEAAAPVRGRRTTAAVATAATTAAAVSAAGRGETGTSS